jgi:hypothetical protein
MRLAVLWDLLAITRRFGDVWCATGHEVAEEFARQEVGDA